MKDLNKKHDSFNMHRKLKEYSKRPPSVLVDTNNRPITEKEQKQVVWEEYVTGLFEYERSTEPTM